MKKYELITNLEVNPEKSKQVIDEFLNHFDEWDKYKDEFIGKEKIEIIKNKDKWDGRYLRKHISLLSTNFSKERLEHIKEVIEYLYPEEKIEEESVFNKKKIILLIIFIILLGIVVLFLSKFFQYYEQNTTKEKVEKNQTKVIEQNTIKEKVKKIEY